MSLTVLTSLENDSFMLAVNDSDAASRGRFISSVSVSVSLESDRARLRVGSAIAGLVLRDVRVRKTSKKR